MGKPKTMTIYKYVMYAPITEPLTLSPADLMSLRRWLMDDAARIGQLRVEVTGLRAEVVKLQVKLDEWNYKQDDVEYVRKDLYDALRDELAAIKPSWADAPTHARSLVGRWWWQNRTNIYFTPVQAGRVVEYRPEET